MLTDIVTELKPERDNENILYNVHSPHPIRVLTEGEREDRDIQTYRQVEGIGHTFLSHFSIISVTEETGINSSQIIDLEGRDGLSVQDKVKHILSCATK